MKKNEWITLGIGIVVIAAIAWAGGFISLPKSTNQTNTTMNQDQQSQASKLPQVEGKNISTDPKLQIIEVVEGAGAVATSGKRVFVNYTGMLQNGSVFDASANHGAPIDFVLGAGRVIKGWDIGISGMKVGGKRRLIIAPEYGYGPQAVGDIIPPNSILIFDVELVSVK